MIRSFLLCLALVIGVIPSIPAQGTAPQVTTPKQEFGFNIGDDYDVLNYTRSIDYWKKLSSESDRMRLVQMGLTSDGRPQYMAIISAPENLKRLDDYREIARKLALAKGLTDDQAHALASEGKAIVWIDGGLHSGETVGAQQLVLTVYDLVSGNDPETLRELHDDIVLCVFANPDGVEEVANWYMRNPDPKQRYAGGSHGINFELPYLWNKYAGHDDNRDFYMSNLAETTNMNRVMFREWFPEVVYNHHQPGADGMVIFAPPFRDPFNYNFNPLISVKVDQLGMAIHSRFVENGMPGSGMRSNATYSMWFNGSLRTVTYFHNEIGLLTEVMGSPSPMQLPLIPGKQLANGDLPDPAPPQIWHYRQSIDYDVNANRAVLDYASRNRENLLYDIYKMGHDAIEAGSHDSWTITPKRIAALEQAAQTGGKPAAADTIISPALYDQILHDPAHRDPRGYILTADQPDFPTATKFVNALLKNGVEVEQATAAFSVAGKQYPANSYVVKTDQAFRPQVLDMFEPQDHPNDFRYPGGPPIPPYDATGYTLALQMGVQFDRVYDGFDGPFKPIETDLAGPVPGEAIAGKGKTAGYLVSHRYNDSFVLTNRLLKAGCPVYWLQDEAHAAGSSLAPGALWIPASIKASSIVEEARVKLGIGFVALDAQPANPMLALHTPRIALYDEYGGLMPSGWIRFLLDQYEFPYTVVHPQQLDAGNLRASFDVLILPDSAVAHTTFIGGMNHSAEAPAQPKPETIPAEYRSWLGTFTEEKTLPQVEAFARAGGSILAIGSSNRLADLMSLPVGDALTEIGKDGKVQSLSQEEFYIPGALIRAQFDPRQPLAYGMAKQADVFFDNSPAFRLNPEAGAAGATTVGWYGLGDLLDSGWAWGREHLHQTVAVAAVPYGAGRVFLCGPEIVFRGQPAGTFKLLFNGIMISAATGGEPDHGN